MDKHTRRTKEVKNTGTFLFVCLLLAFGMDSVHRWEPGYTFAKYDPGWMVTTVMSIMEDGDLDLRNQLGNKPEEAADQTSQGLRGEWYPLHEFLLAWVTVPFYWLLGVSGCLVINVLMIIMIHMLIYDICCRQMDVLSAFSGVILTALTTIFYEYSYSYSIDVFSGLLLVAAFWGITTSGYWAGGLIWGLAVLGRVSNLATAPAFLIFIIAQAFAVSRKEGARKGPGCIDLTRGVAKFVLGALPILMIFGFMNWRMFGSPWTLSYSRWQHFVNGLPVLSSQNGSFTASIMERMPSVLFDRKMGLFFGTPTLLVGWAFGLRLFWQKSRNECLLFALLCILQIIVFSKYEPWFLGGGYRYLIAVAALGAIPLSFAVQNAVDRNN